MLITGYEMVPVEILTVRGLEKLAFHSCTIAYRDENSRRLAEQGREKPCRKGYRSVFEICVGGEATPLLGHSIVYYVVERNTKQFIEMG